MKAIQIENGSLVWSEAELPAVGVGEVRIRVAATAVNRPKRRVSASGA